MTSYLINLELLKNKKNSPNVSRSFNVAEDKQTILYLIPEKRFPILLNFLKIIPFLWISVSVAVITSSFSEARGDTDRPMGNKAPYKDHSVPLVVRSLLRIQF